jgi:hypothetical protein
MFISEYAGKNESASPVNGRDLNNFGIVDLNYHAYMVA